VPLRSDHEAAGRPGRVCESNVPPLAERPGHCGASGRTRSSRHAVNATRAETLGSGPCPASRLLTRRPVRQSLLGTGNSSPRSTYPRHDLLWVPRPTGRPRITLDVVLAERPARPARSVLISAGAGSGQRSRSPLTRPPAANASAPAAADHGPSTATPTSNATRSSAASTSSGSGATWRSVTTRPPPSTLQDSTSPPPSSGQQGDPKETAYCNTATIFAVTVGQVGR
jgi:hypothetical protein